MQRALGLGVLLLALTTACGASINDAYKADLDRRLAGLHGSDASYASVDSFEPLPLAAGQWIQFKFVNEKREPSLVKYSVVGQEGNAYWFEITQENYYHRSDTRLLIAIGDRKDPGSYDVRAFAMKTDGKLHDYPPGMLGLFRSLYKPIVENLVVDWNNLPREDTRVTAGEFHGCFKHRAAFSFGPYHQTSDGWSHPLVPINGLVRSVGVDKPITMELTAFGTEGAKSVF